MEGRKLLAETNPKAVAEAKRLRRASPKTGERMSYRDISAKLAELGHLNERGRPFGPSTVKAMGAARLRRRAADPAARAA